jgi:hypothetical protein
VFLYWAVYSSTVELCVPVLGSILLNFSSCGEMNPDELTFSRMYCLKEELGDIFSDDSG